MIASAHLTPILSRWELDPPVLCAREAYGELRYVFTVLREHAIVRQTTGAGSVDCADCSQSCQVRYIADASGEMQGYICCSDCGLARIPPHATERWKIDTGAFLAAAFAGVNGSVQERVAGQLWQVGKATWSGRSREVWFARTFRGGRVSDALKVLEGRPKAILFTPSETGAERWQDATENLVIALESTLFLDAMTIRFDNEYVESRIIDAGMGPDAAPTPCDDRASRPGCPGSCLRCRD